MIFLLSNNQSKLGKVLAQNLKVCGHTECTVGDENSCDVCINIPTTETSQIDIEPILKADCKMFVDIIEAGKNPQLSEYVSNRESVANKYNKKYICINLYPVLYDDLSEDTWIVSCLEKLLKDQTLELDECNSETSFLYVEDAARKICQICDYTISKADLSDYTFDVASKDIRIKRNFLDVMKRLTHSTSKLAYGIVRTPEKEMPKPDFSKVSFIADKSDRPFDDIIESIIEKIKNKKPDIFEKIDNFKTFAHVKSNLLYGDYSKCPHPLISVIIPVYKRPDLFSKSLQSVLSQDCDFEYEIVVVDNNDDEGKSPNQVVVEEAGSDKVFYYKHEKNIGGYGNFNRGVELSRAEYISYCHDDDMFLPHALRVLWNVHLKNGERCITSRFAVMEEDGFVLNDVLYPKVYYKGLFKDKEWNRVSLYDQFIYATGLDICNLYSRKRFIELGGYNPAHHPSCDNALLASYTYYFGCVSNNIPSFLYRKGENASSTLWPLFADNHLHQRKCIAKKLPLPHFLLKAIYMANYRINSIQHRITWNGEPMSLMNTIPRRDIKLMRIIKRIQLLKNLKFNIPFLYKKDYKLFIPANSKF